MGHDVLLQLTFATSCNPYKPQTVSGTECEMSSSLFIKTGRANCYTDGMRDCVVIFHDEECERRVEC